MTHEAERTEASRIAAQTLQWIDALDLTPTPQNFELWFTYISRRNEELNKAVAALFASTPKPSALDIGRLYDQHLSPRRYAEQIFTIGGLVRDQSTTVAGAIDDAAGAAASYSEHLAAVAGGLEETDAGASVSSVILELLQSTEDVQLANASLRNRLLGAADQVRRLQEELTRVQQECMIDPLTNVGNRRLFDTSLSRMLADAERGGFPVSLLMVDIDHFKFFNDLHGHVIGDDVLRLVASAIKQNSRREDLVCRYGGDEFAIILPHTPLEGAVLAGEKIRATLAGRELNRRSTGESLGRLTVSIGASQYQKGETADVLVERTDKSMYAAKRSGRDRQHLPAAPKPAIAMADDADRQDRLVWRDEYESGEVEIDRQHRRLFELANILFDPLLEGQSRRIEAFLDELALHVSGHFAYEESVLAVHRFPELDRHRQSHAQLLKDVQRLRTSFEAGTATLADLRDFLVHTVILDHLLDTDTRFFSLFSAPTAA